MQSLVAVPQLLAQVALFRDLTLAQLTAITPWFRLDTFQANEPIFHEGDEANRFWVVREGEVKIVRYALGGREVVIEVIPAGEVFGGSVLLMPIHPATAVALSRTATLSLSIEQYHNLLNEYGAVGVRVIEILGERLLSVIHMRTLAADRVERRMAHILLKMASKSGVKTPEGIKINLSLTRQDLADLADTTLETAIRTMSVFRKNGLVRTLRGGYVVILDENRLRQRREE